MTVASDFDSHKNMERINCRTMAYDVSRNVCDEVTLQILVSIHYRSTMSKFHGNILSFTSIEAARLTK